jgi:hypothetical protein
MTDEGWGLVKDPGNLFGPAIVRWYPAVQWFDEDGFADLLRSTSLYRRLDGDVRDPLLDAIAERIRTQMGDRASRRYLSVLRAGRPETRLEAAARVEECREETGGLRATLRRDGSRCPDLSRREG